MLLGGCQSLTQQSAPVVQGSQPRIGALPPAVRPMPSGSSVSPDSSGESSNGGNSSVVAYKPRAKVQVVTEASPPPSSRSAPTVMVSAPPPSTPRLATTVRDPDDDRPESYKVKAGDTLYSIALNNGQDYREIAAWNQLEDPSIIKVDQVLRLTPPAGFVASAPVASSPAPVASKNAAASKESPPPRVAETPRIDPPRKTEEAPPEDGVLRYPRALKRPYTTEAMSSLALQADGDKPAASSKPPVAERVAKADKTPPSDKADKAEKTGRAEKTEKATKASPKDTEKDSKTTRTKPTEAAPKIAVKPVEETTPSAPSGSGDEEVSSWLWPTQGKVINRFTDASKGVDISGRAGQTVQAAAGGKVVYSGAGLRGYGKLIIIKHNKTFLTAYAHNSQILVKEGQGVSKGQKIAEMGNTDADQVKLHFEVRRFGKPVDPLKYLGAP